MPNASTAPRCLFPVVAAVIAMTSAQSDGVAGPRWTDGHAAKTRLLVGGVPTREGVSVYAGFEMKLNPGWKTYWRLPGDAGGIPPHFSFAGSRNLKRATVLYPVPSRFEDPVGTTIGYKKAVTFPIKILPKDPASPVTLKLNVDFGICEEICVPASVRHDAVIDPRAVNSMPQALSLALDRVPRPQQADTRANVETAPVRLAAAKADMRAKTPHFAFHIETQDPKHTDLFVEPPDGLFLGVAKRTGLNGNVVKFRVDVLAREDIPRFKGQRLRLTIAGPGGGYERSWRVPD